VDYDKIYMIRFAPVNRVADTEIISYVIEDSKSKVAYSSQGAILSVNRHVDDRIRKRPGT